MGDPRRLDGPLIIGGGLAGLAAALGAGPRPVTVVTQAPLMEAASSAWAQGGLAAALGADDSIHDHAADTVAAGGGLSDPEAALALAAAGPETVLWLAELGAPFDRDDHGRFRASLEAAHSRARVARVGGDGAGRAIMTAVVAAVRAADHITVIEGVRLVGLGLDANGRVTGARIARADRQQDLLSGAVILATGGIGGLYSVTTNPPALRGEGLALAALAGAEIIDPEFVQFHPTALDLGLDPAPLASEALRGEGARLVDRQGRGLTEDHPLGDLAPRDVVARAVHQAIREERGAYLDARQAIGAAFPDRFPAVFAACLRSGLDPRESPMPIAPAAHYHMGGIAASLDGQTGVAGLYAVGECAVTGIHGANRLASNSLLEAVAFGRRAGRVAAETAPSAQAFDTASTLAEVSPWALAALRTAMSVHAGVLRSHDGLGQLIALIDRIDAAEGRSAPTLAARLVAQAALDRRESRGAHSRIDFPDTLAEARHTRLRPALLTETA